MLHRRPLLAIVSFFSAVALCGLTIAPADAQERPRRQVEAAQLILEPYGFMPRELTMTEGLAEIKVFNRVGFPELDLRVEKEEGPSRTRTTLASERAPRRNKRWDHTIDLTPGVYIVREASNPKWVCRITVLPAKR